jgi:hypothetical protein
VTAYFAACLADPGKTNADGTCANFAREHAACVACTEPSTQAGPVRWAAKRSYYTLNLAGCISIQQAPEPGKCAEAFNAAVQCQSEACTSCFPVGGTNEQFLQRRECQKLAQKAECQKYEAAQGVACNGYKDAGSSALTCFNAGTEVNEVLFTRVIRVFCVGNP